MLSKPSLPEAENVKWRDSPMKLFPHQKWNLMFKIIVLFFLCVCHYNSPQQYFSYCAYTVGLPTLLVRDVLLRYLFPSGTKILSWTVLRFKISTGPGLDSCRVNIAIHIRTMESFLADHCINSTRKRWNWLQLKLQAKG